MNRDALISILKKLGVPDHLAFLIKQLHTDVKVKLKVGSADSCFNATIGVKQGDNMAPVLFLFYMQAAIEAMDRDWPVSKPEFKYKLDSQMTGRSHTARGKSLSFWNCLYADDSAFIFASRADLAAGAVCCFETLRLFGLQMHMQGSKTEAMLIPHNTRQFATADTSNLSLAGGFIPFTEVFRYLGSHIHYSLSDKHEVQVRISSASAMFGSLKGILCARRVDLLRKGRIFSVLVHSILLYGCEAWALTRDLYRSILSFHNLCVRKMNRITLEQTEQYRITTASLEGKLGIRPIQAIIDDRCMRWAGHVARMPEQRAPRQLLSSWVRAKRPIGRPHMTIAHSMRDTIKRAGLNSLSWISAASDRDHWKTIASQVKPKISRKPGRPHGRQSKSVQTGLRRDASTASRSAGLITLVGCLRVVTPQVAQQYGMRAALAWLQ